MLESSLETASAEGIRAAFSMGLSNYSQKILMKMEFEKKVEICNDDYCQVGHDKNKFRL